MSVADDDRREGMDADWGVKGNMDDCSWAVCKVNEVQLEKGHDDMRRWSRRWAVIDRYS